jgi:hypothetical protein
MPDKEPIEINEYGQPVDTELALKEHFARVDAAAKEMELVATRNANDDYRRQIRRGIVDQAYSRKELVDIAVIQSIQEGVLEKTKAENDKLKAAIRKHRDQKSDDRCWLDDVNLYRVLGGQEWDDYRSDLPPKCEFLESCARFWEQRQRPVDLKAAEYDESVPMTIRQLEDEVTRLRAACQSALDLSDHADGCGWFDIPINDLNGSTESLARQYAACDCHKKECRAALSPKPEETDVPA